MASMTLFVHAGGAKTGSSALQNFCELGAPSLEGLGFAYENRLNIKSKFEITSGNGESLFELLRATTTTDGQIDRAVRSYFGKCKNAICSSESLAECGRHSWARLYESSLRLGVQLKVIFYVRNVIPFLLSAYDQAIKRHGEYRSFDEWVLEADWQHARALKVISDVMPKGNVQVSHFDRSRKRLIQAFFEILGVRASLELNPGSNAWQVNRSLTNEERLVLIAVNRALGETYSKELSDLLIYANPNVAGEGILIDKSTSELLCNRFSGDVEWVNETFFHGRAVVSVWPMEATKRTQNIDPKVCPGYDREVEKLVLNWAIERVRTIKEETGQHILDVLNAAAQNESAGISPEIPADFSLLSYLLLNPDVLFAGGDPILHFIRYGKSEGRRYKFVGRNASP